MEEKKTGSNEARVCPNCSATLTGRSCKIRCPRCNYFESCSDLEAFPADFGPRPNVVVRPRG